MRASGQKRDQYSVIVSRVSLGVDSRLSKHILPGNV